MHSGNCAFAVSACLLGIACRYDGRSNFCGPIAELLKKGAVLPVCPETFGGFPVPRLPCERKGDEVYRRDGYRVTDAFQKGVARALSLVLASHASIAILKSKSPSCGFGTIYDGSFTGHLCRGHGLFAEALIANGIPVMSEQVFIRICGKIFPEHCDSSR
ncbi:MAG: DUF523 domain-containing protein [Desulfovibrio sp.]|nr:DUF523 domain-containing protein [Desulfovibrio sp.]